MKIVLREQERERAKKQKKRKEKVSSLSKSVNGLQRVNESVNCKKKRREKSEKRKVQERLNMKLI